MSTRHPVSRPASTAIRLGLLLILLSVSSCIATKHRTLAVRVPPVVTIGVQPLPLKAALVVPDALKNAVYRERVWCLFSTMNLQIQTGPALEKAAVQALPQAFRSVEVVRDKSTIDQYDVAIEPSVPAITLSTECNWLPTWLSAARSTQQAKVMLHLVVTGRTGQVLFDKTYTSEAHEKESPADAIGDAYAEILEVMVHQFAGSPNLRAYADNGPTGTAETGMPLTETAPEISGMGFLAGYGYVVTNYHLVAGLPSVKVRLRDTVTPATVALRDRLNDVALLRLQSIGRVRGGPEMKPPTGLRLGEASRVRAGDRVWTVTMPSQEGRPGVVTEGSVVAPSGPGGDRRFFQVAMTIPADATGSPLLNEHGEVIGLLVPPGTAAEAFSLSGELPRNASLAVKISYAKALLGLLPESEFLPLSQDPLPAQDAADLAPMVSPQVVMITH